MGFVGVRMGRFGGGETKYLSLGEKGAIGRDLRMGKWFGR
jgi:hypothetical protein